MFHSFFSYTKQQKRLAYSLQLKKRGIFKALCYACLVGSVGQHLNVGVKKKI